MTREDRERLEQYLGAADRLLKHINRARNDLVYDEDARSLFRAAGLCIDRLSDECRGFLFIDEAKTGRRQ